MVVSGGFVEISGNRVSILADIAENKDEIDVAAARSETEDLGKVLGAWKGNEEDFEIELEKLEKAQARLALGSGK
jgi:F-type H+-transporting ATPase subunit epsilon